METYLVGGAVRDEMLNMAVRERDWVVVGSSPQEMVDKGYRPVGKDFPVFLHPKTHEEYALARTERKTGKGYKGFTFHCASDVTLEQDLKRRDLTVNAMAKSADGNIIDPFGGQKDLQAQLLRHVSSAFTEDPVRILRVARFAARFEKFQVHPETYQLMREIVQSGEIDALVPERVSRELNTALSERTPERFFNVLTQCGAAAILFAELDSDQMDMAALNRAIEISEESDIRFAALLNKQCEASIQALCQRLRIPKSCTRLAIVTAKYAPVFQRILSATPETTIDLLEKLDASRRPPLFERFLLATQATLDDREIAASSKQYLVTAYQRTTAISAKPLFEKGYRGVELGKALHRRKVEAISRLTTHLS